MLAGAAKTSGQRQVQLLAQDIDLLLVVFLQLLMFCLLLGLPPRQSLLLRLLTPNDGLQGLDVIGKISGVQHAAHYTAATR